MKLVTGIFISVLICFVNCNNEAPEVKIKQGILRGKLGKSRKGREFYAFTSIPYAKPPVGELRFKPPVQAEPWDGILDATKQHPVCPQTNLFTMNKTLIGQEDCLYLNIHTPKLPSSEIELLPVMLYIHGGGWFTGSGSTDFHGPKFLLDKDIVLVTINYRLGALGFLTTGDSHVLGNNGLKDQAMAIKWVKENVAQFGGDPNKLTIFGQSAGASSVHYHMVSPMTRDLINGAIAQSGSALTFWSLTPHFLSTRYSKSLAKHLGCSPFKTDEMMECLKQVDAYEFVKGSEIFVEWDLDPMMIFIPVIEPNVPGAFLVEDPISTVKAGKAAKVPFMTGFTTDEGGLRAAEIFSQPDLVKDLDKNFKKLIPLVLHYRDVAIYKHRETSAVTIKEFYFGDKPIDHTTIDEFIRMNSDGTMLVGVDAAVELHTKISKNQVYYYLFGYRGSKSWANIFGGSSDYDYGVVHCDDLLYLFDSEVFYPDYQPSKSDEDMIETMTTLWTNFAKFGNPTPDGDSLKTKWDPVTSKQNYMYIKGPSDLRLQVDLLKERRDFWRNLEINGRRQIIRDEL